MLRSGTTSDTATVAALLSAITVGICLGFLPWNFHPARIFMGDTGSMLLGMLVAIATIAGVGRDPFPPTGGDVAVIALPLLVPLLVLGIPFLDVLLAIVRRMRKGLGIAHADKQHIHHQLILIGHGHRQAVLLMYLWSVLLAGSALALGWVDGRIAVGAILGCVLILFLVTALPRLLDRRRNGSSDGRIVAEGPVPDDGVRPARDDSVHLAPDVRPGGRAEGSPDTPPGETEANEGPAAAM
jgi:UDP-GlcNAc:undecaprenyl-phosphate GlcNAc-1-phosphate transferase